MLDELSVVLGTPVKVTVGAPSAIQSILKKSESSQRVLEEATEGFELQARRPVGEVAGSPIATPGGRGVAACAHRVVFGEAGVEQRHERHVEPVEPDHRHVSGVYVLVPRPVRGYDEVSRLHRNLRAVDAGEGAAPFEYETEGILCVTVVGCPLAGQHQLQPGVERLSRARLSLQARIFENQDPPFRFLGMHQMSRLHKSRADGGVVPQFSHCV